jgi:hypothetical protein
MLFCHDVSSCEFLAMTLGVTANVVFIFQVCFYGFKHWPQCCISDGFHDNMLQPIELCSIHIIFLLHRCVSKAATFSDVFDIPQVAQFQSQVANFYHDTQPQFPRVDFIYNECGYSLGESNKTGFNFLRYKCCLSSMCVALQAP